MHIESELTNLIGGGLLIGLAISIYKIKLGRVLGISGLLRSSWNSPTKIQSLWVILSIFIGAYLFNKGYGENHPIYSAPLMQYGLSGAMIGMGSVLANGCTSGHCIHGLSIISHRSIIATILFITFGVITQSWILPI